MPLQGYVRSDVHPGRGGRWHACSPKIPSLNRTTLCPPLRRLSSFRPSGRSSISSSSSGPPADHPPRWRPAGKSISTGRTTWSLPPWPTTPDAEWLPSPTRPPPWSSASYVLRRPVRATARRPFELEMPPGGTTTAGGADCGRSWSPPDCGRRARRRSAEHVTVAQQFGGGSLTAAVHRRALAAPTPAHGTCAPRPPAHRSCVRRRRRASRRRVGRRARSVVPLHKGAGVVAGTLINPQWFPPVGASARTSPSPEPAECQAGDFALTAAHRPAAGRWSHPGPVRHPRPGAARSTNTGHQRCDGGGRHQCRTRRSSSRSQRVTADRGPPGSRRAGAPGPGRASR